MKYLLIFLLFTISTYAQENNYKEVTSKLDRDGEFYMYMNTKDWLNSLLNTTEKIKDFGTKLTPKDAPKIELIFHVLKKLTLSTGTGEISGVGISSKKINDLTRNTFYFHHEKNKNKGILWKALGGKPHELKEFKMLSQETIFATFQDFYSEATWQWIQEIIAKSNIPPLQQALNRIIYNSARNGVDLVQALKSIQQIGFVITAHPTKTITLPLKNKNSISVPQMTFSLMLKTKNNSIMSIYLKNGGMNFPQRQVGKNRLYLNPTGKTNFGTTPAVAYENGYFILSTSAETLTRMLTQKKENCLLESKEYKALSKGLPTTGNGFSFTSKKLNQHIINITKSYSKENKNNDPEASLYLPIVKIFYNFPAQASVLQVTKTGILIKTQTHN